MSLLLRYSIAFGIAGSAFLHGEETGTIVGRVVDARSGFSLAGASIRVSGTALETVSGTNGDYTLPQLRAGSHTLIVDYLGLGHMEQAVVVAAGQSIRQDLAMAGQVTRLERLVVEGSSVGQARAINLQKNSANLRNIIAADAIGSFPDQNAAEALSRVSGISIERDQGEGRYVTIRGIDSDMNGYSVDGLALAAPRAGERAVLLDIIPSEVLERLEVTKAVLPDQPGDAIGGAIEIKTPSAFTRSGNTNRFTAQLNYSEARDTWMPHFDGAVGRIFGQEIKTGLLVAFSYDERETGTDAQRLTPWSLAAAPGGGRYYLPGETQIRHYLLLRKRKGLTANLEIKAGPSSSFFLRSFYNDYFDSQIRHRSRVRLSPLGVVALTDSSGVINVGNVSALGRTRISVQVRDREEELSVWGVSAGGEQRLGSLVLDYQVGYSFADEDTPGEFTADYRLGGTTQVGFVGGASRNPEFSFTGVGQNPASPAAYTFEATEEVQRLVEEDHWEVMANARRDFATAHPTFVKLGVRARWKEKRNAVDLFDSGATPASLATLDRVTSGFGQFNLNRQIPIVDPSIRQAYFSQRQAFAPTRNFADSTSGDWRTTEDVTAAYAMGGASFGHVRVFGGARIERTKFEARGFTADAATEVALPVRVGRTQDRLMPGVHLRYAPSARTVLRAAYTETLARPGFEQSAAASIWDNDEITRGNPTLSHPRSRNWDFAADYYLPRSLGVASVAAFAKNVEQFIFPRVFTETIAGEDYVVTSYENGRRGELRGIELGFQSRLTFLPRPFDGFGLSGNVAFIDSDATLPASIGRRTAGELAIRFPRQSDTVGNVALTYEKAGLFVRLAGTFRGGYLDEVGLTPSEDVHIQKHTQWDLSSRYRISDRWTVFANLINVNDEPLVDRYGISGRLRQFETYSWSMQLGVKFAQ
jgi:TonB-dependent receptor